MKYKNMKIKQKQSINSYWFLDFHPFLTQTTLFQNKSNNNSNLSNTSKKYPRLLSHDLCETHCIVG